MNKFKTLLFVAAGFAAVSCTKTPVVDDPPPTPYPVAKVVITDYAVPINADPGFIAQNDKNTASVSWDFGDGTNSALFAPLHVYSTPGLKTVKLTAFSADKTKKAYATVNIAVGKRILDSIVLLKFPTTKGNDGATSWHSDGTNPNVLFQWDTAGSPKYTYQTTQPIPNASPNKVRYSVRPGSPLTLLRTKWVFELTDVVGASMTTMIKWTVDMNTAAATANPIKLGAADGYDYQIFWHLE
ncbi:MAG: PKD domain-containing protein [Bacteroidetes bacterium]|nr:PKD domain-containing protein [Bacteroidota bacterium]